MGSSFSFENISESNKSSNQKSVSSASSTTIDNLLKNSLPERAQQAAR